VVEYSVSVSPTMMLNHPSWRNYMDVFDCQSTVFISVLSREKDIEDELS